MTVEEALGIDPAGGDPERALAIAYAPARARGAVAAVLALDATLARLARVTRDPLVAQMRLAWWREAAGALPARVPAGQPILRALADAATATGADVASHGVTLVEAWEALLGDDPIAHARRRGMALFAALGAVTGVGEVYAEAGAAWGLADLSRASPDPAVARRGADEATAGLSAGLPRHWPRLARAQGALVLSAAMDVRGLARGTPGRLLRLVRLRLTGR